MSDKNNSIRNDIARAMAGTYRPITIPEGGRRDTLEYHGNPNAKFTPMPWVQKAPVSPLAGVLGSGKSGKPLAQKYKPRKI